MMRHGKRRGDCEFCQHIMGPGDQGERFCSERHEDARR